MRKENNKKENRRVGFEIEYAGLTIEKTAEIVHNFLGGKVHKKHDALFELKETKLGDFTIEADASYIKELAKNTNKLEKSGKKGLAENINISLGKAIGKVSESIVPFEIISPPVKISQIAKLDSLREKLLAAGVYGTKEKIYYAFGMHINPEVLTKDVTYIKNHLQSFLLLVPWLKEVHKIDLTRRVSSFIDPFPKSYMELLLDVNYKPDMEKLIKDYHKHNPTRNRALDLLPLFADINEPLVRKLYGKKEKINKRPTFHYRLPNCQIADKNWTIKKEWERWLFVEKLAENKEMLNNMIEKWQEHNKKLISTESGWIKIVKKEMNQYEK